MEVKVDDKLTKIIKLLDDDHDESPPELIFNLVGTKTALIIDEDIKAALKFGLLKTAKTTDAWILTDGLDSGVVRFVADALAEDLDDGNVTVLGVVPWRCVPYRHELVKPNELGMIVRSFEQMKIKMQKNKFLNQQANQTTTMVSLNPNHTHFILVDDGRVGVFGAESEFREKFQKALSRYYNYALTVLLVVQGDLETMKTILSTLQSGLPVILVKVKIVKSSNEFFF